MRIALLAVLTLAFTIATPARAQSAPTSPCAACCLLSLICCTGDQSPAVDAALPWLKRFLPGSDDVNPTTTANDEAPAPRTPGLRAMAF